MELVCLSRKPEMIGKKWFSKLQSIIDIVQKDTFWRLMKRVKWLNAHFLWFLLLWRDKIILEKKLVIRIYFYLKKLNLSPSSTVHIWIHISANMYLYIYAIFLQKIVISHSVQVSWCRSAGNYEKPNARFNWSSLHINVHVVSFRTNR